MEEEQGCLKEEDELEFYFSDYLPAQVYGSGIISPQVTRLQVYTSISIHPAHGPLSSTHTTHDGLLSGVGSLTFFPP
jgi:hypothetical protein